MKKVSVIVPVYNAAQYLAECLGNLVHQTLEDMELILVNDASKDASYQIMEDCERQFPDRVLLVNCAENHGAGGARNIGISYASGEYIGFVDSDDLPDPKMYEKLYREAKAGSYDVVDCGYYNEAKDTAVLYVTDEMTGAVTEKTRRELIVSGGYVFTKLFRRSLFADEKLRFREHCILEDADFLGYVFATIERIGHVKEILYVYKDRAGSLSKEKEPERYVQALTDAMQAIHAKLHGLPRYEQIREAVEYELLQMYSFGVNMCTHAKNGKELLEALRSVRMQTVAGGYENSYVKNKIGPKDIALMQAADRETR